MHMRARQQAERRSLFASLIDALHDLRRRQAERILREHRHLITQSCERAAFIHLLNPEDYENVDH
jgi:hypothetical protein